MKKSLLVLAIILMVGAGAFLHRPMIAGAAYLWDHHAILGGLYSNSGVPLKVDSDGTLYVTGGGSGTPGGLDTYVQYNDGGYFAGDSTFNFNKTTKVLSVAGLSTSGAADGSRKILLQNNTTASPTASSDELYFEGNLLKSNENGTEREVVATGKGVSGQYASAEYTDTIAAGAATINWNLGNVHYIVLAAGANTLTLSNPIAGGRYVLILKQAASGAASTVTFSPVPFAPGGTLPTLTATNSAVDVITLCYSTALGKYVLGSSLDMK